uniref:Fibronectin type-III domain-containing protein n=1 Tax=Monopterus albus TaxID=43700 RepID=A0A3Q3QP85_MONAL
KGRDSSGKQQACLHHSEFPCSPPDHKGVHKKRPWQIHPEADKCRVVWDAPEDDGGCEVDSYILEKCETRRMVWSTYSASVVTPYCSVMRLVEGNEYVFRVRAENKMGTGPAIESKPVTVKTQFSRPGPPDAPEVTKVSKRPPVLERF